MPQWLETCLDYGISEFDFWNMTIGELGRLIESKDRIMKREAQEKATYDYILADLVGKSIGRLYSSSNKYPEISEVYPTLFDSEEIQKQKAEKQDNLSAIRFKHFVASYNSRQGGYAKKNE